VNEQESREAIEAAVDFSFKGPPTAWFEHTPGAGNWRDYQAKRLNYVVYACRGDEEQELVGQFTNIIVDAIHAAKKEHGKICLAWAWFPESEPNMVDRAYLDYGPMFPQDMHQEGFKVYMRFVLFDQDLNAIRIAEHLVKAEGEAIERLADAES